VRSRLLLDTSSHRFSTLLEPRRWEGVPELNVAEQRCRPALAVVEDGVPVRHAGTHCLIGVTERRQGRFRPWSCADVDKMTGTEAVAGHFRGRRNDWVTELR
jgi:hypothetical protein